MEKLAFWYGDKQYVVETASAEEKTELKAANPELYARYFSDKKEVVEVSETKKSK